MKKAPVWCVIFAVLLAVSTLGAAAAEGEALPELPAGFEEFRAAVPPEAAELLPEGFFAADAETVAGAVAAGGSLSAVLAAVGQVTGVTLRESAALLAGILGILVVMALARAWVAGRTGGAAGRAFSLCGVLTLTVFLLSSGRARFAGISAYFDTVRGLFTAILPLMGTLYAMGGNVGAAAANHAVLSAFLAVIGTVCGGTVLPVAGLSLSLALTEAASGAVSLRPLAGFIKRTYTLCFSLLMTLLCGVLGLQTTLTHGADTLALRTVRFAAGSFLPVAGGSVSEALRTVAGSVTYLRGVVGMGGVLVTFFVFLPTFVSVTLTRAAFLLGGAAAKLLSLEAEEKLLSEFGSVYGYFMAVIAALFITAVFALTLFARCAAAGGA